MNESTTVTPESGLPFVAVVTPTRNRTRLLARLHESIKTQTLALPWIHVVVDDASDAPVSAADVSGATDKLVIVRNEKCRGALVSRNIALDIAHERSVDLVAFVDDDDWLLPNCFESIYSVWSHAREVGWYVFPCRFVGDAAGPQRPRPSGSFLVDYVQGVLLDKQLTGDHLHVIAMNRVGDARFSTRGRRNREWTLLYAIARSGPFLYVDKEVQAKQYLQGGLSISTRSPTDRLEDSLNGCERSAAAFLSRPSVDAFGKLAKGAAGLVLKAALALASGFSGRRPIDMRPNP